MYNSGRAKVFVFHVLSIFLFSFSVPIMSPLEVKTDAEGRSKVETTGKRTVRGLQA